MSQYAVVDPSTRRPVDRSDRADVEQLHGFDRLRSLVSKLVRGTEGAFTGYTRFELARAIVAEPRRLTLVAEVVEVAARWHRVAYMASCEPASTGDPSDLVIASAEGVTGHGQHHRNRASMSSCVESGRTRDEVAAGSCYP